MVSLPLLQSKNETTQPHPESLPADAEPAPDHIPSCGRQWEVQMGLESQEAAMLNLGGICKYLLAVTRFGTH